METVRGLDKENPTGLFFDEQTVGSIVQAVNRFEQEGKKITAENCRKNAEQFSAENFSKGFQEFVNDVLSS